MYSAFQFGFDHGYQVIYDSALIPAYNGNSVRQEYTPTSHELRHIERLNQIEALKLKEQVASRDLRAYELKLEALELRRLKESLADEALQNELIALLLERKQVQLAQMELIRLILELEQEDEAILIILSTMPF